MLTDSFTSRRVWLIILWILIATLALVWWRRFRSSPELVSIRREPVAVMGTTSQIIAVIPRGRAPQGERILAVAESELRRMEVLLSTWIDHSELSRLNGTAPGVEVPLSREVLDLLARSRRLYHQTQGAFDITAGPLIERWRLATTTGTMPEETELSAFRLSSSWDDFSLSEGAGTRLRSTARLDVDGIAKGYAVDRAMNALLEAGAVGGLVEVGGDLRVVGVSPEGGTWPIGIRSPFSDTTLASIRLEQGAVCTSGAYARPLEIGRLTVSHIIDPRIGQPVDEAASVTVIARETDTADAWATALSVLGVAGLDQIPAGAGIEALVILGTPEALSAVATAGFPELGGRFKMTVERRTESLEPAQREANRN